MLRSPPIAAIALIGEERSGLIHSVHSGSASAAAVQAGSWRRQRNSRSTAGTSSSTQNVAESAPHISYCMYPASACTVSWVATRSSWPSWVWIRK